ncbi:hypothetical protein [Micromonospora sp. NBC_01813]|uniref:hypothetical protein n=1 Tax=Micromonospora sp. NBC_01813 TaxID=2975988 RepID=UPI002DDA05A7|nr:hypothetical protein [Micromonospora sp. NBC_01813]WSA07925.1 hypothetical protein OG958_27510 [Micromonospora sp. NBC_01813]
MSLTPPADSPAGAVVARQLSLFGVAAVDPTPGDLAGLLAGPGRISRMGGTVRVSVDVDHAWRVHVLVAELRHRGLTPSWRQTPEGRLVVRTAYTAVLSRLGAAWLHPRPGSPPPATTDTDTDTQPDTDAQADTEVRDDADDRLVKRPPIGFHLAGQRLRLWAAAAGVRDQLGFRLGLGEPDADNWSQVGAALAAIGLPAALLDARSGGPAFRVVGRRRLTRLAELLGDRPSAAPPDGWV